MEATISTNPVNPIELDLEAIMKHSYLYNDFCNENNRPDGENSTALYILNLLLYFTGEEGVVNAYGTASDDERIFLPSLIEAINNVDKSIIERNLNRVRERKHIDIDFDRDVNYLISVLATYKYVYSLIHNTPIGTIIIYLYALNESIQEIYIGDVDKEVNEVMYKQILCEIYDKRIEPFIEQIKPFLDLHAYTNTNSKNKYIISLMIDNFKKPPHEHPEDVDYDEFNVVKVIADVAEGLVFGEWVGLYQFVRLMEDYVGYVMEHY